MIDTVTCFRPSCDACRTAYDNGDFEPHWPDHDTALLHARESDWTWDPVSKRIVCLDCAEAAGAYASWSDDDWCPGAWTVAEIVAEAIAARRRVDEAKGSGRG